MKIEQLPEDQARVEAYDRVLRTHSSAMLDEVTALQERYKARGITTIQGSGWPLRPLFLSHQTLQTIAGSLQQGFVALRDLLLDKISDLDWLCEQLPIPKATFEALDMRASLESPAFLSWLRPDGFLFEDRFTLIEPNFGNGSMISNAYTEIIYDFFQGAPTFQALDWDLPRQLHRPFQGYLSMLRKRLSPDKERHFVALFCHHWEHEVILGWEERVIQQLTLAQQVMAAQGIDSRVVHEHDFVIDPQGHTRLKADNQRVDCVAQFTIGTSFIDEPHLFAGPLQHLRGPSIGDAPLIKPIACVCVDKGTLPLLAHHSGWQQPDSSGFRVEIPETLYPSPKDAAEYRINRQGYVLKKSFDGKDTRVGISTPGRIWNRVLQQALQGKEYVLQRYQPMPQTIMPMCFDGKVIEWVPVRVELSPFIIEGAYAGAIARYAPDAEGLVMSPPPENMGLTNVFAC